VTRTQLATLLNVTVGAVDVWIKRGLRSDRGRFDRRRSLAWVVANVEPQNTSSGVSRGAVRAAELLGNPRRQRGNGHTGNGHDDLANPARMRARRDKAISEKLERENEIARGELCRIADIATEYAQACVIIRSKLLSLPSKCAPALQAAAAHGPEAVRRLLHNEIVEVLTALSSPDAEDEAA
jgi:hypothetical protein